MPLYQLFGGKVREKIDVYSYANGDTPEIIFQEIDKLVKQGYTYIRCQLGLYGGILEDKTVQHELTGSYYHPKRYMEDTIALFAKIRQKYGMDLELLHDVHERLNPQEAIRFAKRMEAFDLFLLEDLLAPEQINWLSNIKSHTTTPLAICELFTNINEWHDIIARREVDIIRCHVSQIGGITPALKLGVLCELFGVQIIWHGPSDMTPIGVAVNTHLNISLKASICSTR